METTIRIFLNRFFLTALCLGVAALGCSFLAVFMFDLSPCVFCKLQRIPYALLTANAGLGLLSSFKLGFYRAALACLAFGVILGLTHFLIQMDVVPDFCSSQRGFNSPEEFLQTLQSPACSKISWSILGVPLSLLNAMIHSCVLGVSVHLKSKRKLI